MFDDKASPLDGKFVAGMQVKNHLPHRKFVPRVTKMPIAGHRATASKLFTPHCIAKTRWIGCA
eukprot:1845357-Amphidinium_carterae.1